MLFNSLHLLVPLTSGQDEAKTPSCRYVTEDVVAHILAYCYSGSDASLLINHVISPLAQWLVNMCCHHDWHLTPLRLERCGSWFVALDYTLMRLY